MNRIHRRRPWMAIALTSLAVVSSASGCKKHDEPDKNPPTPIPIQTAKVEKRLLQPSFMVIGTVVAMPDRVATLTAQNPGLVSRLVLTEGAPVKPGNLVIQLDEQKARHERDRAKAAYDRLLAKPWADEVKLASSAVDRAKAAHLLAEVRWRKALELRMQSPNLVPELQVKEQESQEQIARAELAAAETQLRLLTKEYRNAQEQELLSDWQNAELQLQWCRVVSPLAGEIVEIKARVGQRADAGVSLATVMDISEVLVQARIPAQRLRSLLQTSGKSTKEAGKVRAPAYPGEVFPASLYRIGQQTEGQTGDVPIWVHVANPKRLLRIGMTVQADLLGAPVEALAIPEVAMTVNEEGHRIVTLIKEGKAFPAEIVIADAAHPEVRADGWVRIVDGLKEGDEVATQNGYALPEGFPVLVQSPEVKNTSSK